MSDELWLEQIWQEHYKLLYDTGLYTVLEGGDKAHVYEMP